MNRRRWFIALLIAIALIVALMNIFGDSNPISPLSAGVTGWFQAVEIVSGFFLFMTIAIILTALVVKILVSLMSALNRIANPRAKLIRWGLFNGWIEKYAGFIFISIGCGMIVSSPWTSFSMLLEGSAQVSAGLGMVAGFAIARRIIGEHTPAPSK